LQEPRWNDDPISACKHYLVDKELAGFVRETLARALSQAAHPGSRRLIEVHRNRMLGLIEQADFKAGIFDRNASRPGFGWGGQDGPDTDLSSPLLAPSREPIHAPVRALNRGLVRILENVRVGDLWIEPATTRLNPTRIAAPDQDCIQQEDILWYCLF
jgi:hypothetical protein